MIQIIKIDNVCLVNSPKILLFTISLELVILDETNKDWIRGSLKTFDFIADKNILKWLLFNDITFGYFIAFQSVI